MPENNDATGNEVKPTDSSPENTSTEATQTPAGANTSGLPFHENPEIQDYIQRQVDARTERNRADIIAAMNLAKPREQTVDELDQFASEFAAENDANPKAIRKLIAKVVEEARKSVSAETGEIRARQENYDMMLRFGALYAQSPDAKQHEKVMLDLYNGMTEVERNFVQKSPDGPNFLYTKAKTKASLGMPTARDFAAGSSPSSRGSSFADKVGDSSVLSTRAADALARGDKAAYEEAIRKMR